MPRTTFKHVLSSSDEEMTDKEDTTGAASKSDRPNSTEPTVPDDERILSEMEQDLPPSGELDYDEVMKGTEVFDTPDGGVPLDLPETSQSPHVYTSKNNDVVLLGNGQPMVEQTPSPSDKKEHIRKIQKKSISKTRGKSTEGEILLHGFKFNNLIFKLILFYLFIY